MNWLDLVLLLGVAVAIFVGYEIGLLKVGVALGAGLVGLLLAGKYYAPMGGWLEALFQEGPARIVAFFFIFLASAAVVLWVAYLLREAVTITFADMVSKLGGAALGIVLGGLLMGLVVLLLFRFTTVPVEIPVGLERTQLATVAQAYRSQSPSRQSMAETLEGSALASFLIREIPALPGFIPSDFDPARELAFR